MGRERNYTKGPYYVHPRKQSLGISTSPHPNNPKWDIADAYTQADADLMAASDELLESLEGMVKCFGIYVNDELDELAINGAISAIAKAYGEKP